MSSATTLPTSPTTLSEWLDSWHRTTESASWIQPDPAEIWNAAQASLLAEVKQAQGRLQPSHEAEAEAQRRFETWLLNQRHQPSSIDCWRKGIEDQTLYFGIRVVEENMVMRMPSEMSERPSEAAAFKETMHRAGSTPASIWMDAKNYQRSLDRSSGCSCDPPGSGEEFCTGHCIIRADVQYTLNDHNELIGILMGVRHAVLNNELVPSNGSVILNVVVPVANAVAPFLPGR